jgi:GNAT superfamily N-acetyltransferase
MTDLTATLDALQDAYLTLCRVLDRQPGVAWGREPDVAWGMTSMPVPVFNRIMRIRLGAADAEARIGEITDRYVAAGIPGSWWLDPESSPGDLGARLERRGLVGDAIPGMRIEASDVPDLDLPTGITLSWVGNRDEMDAATRLVAEGFGLPADLTDQLTSLMTPLGEVGVPVRTIVAALDGRPVASAQGVEVGDAVAVYNVATLDGSRGRGIGRAVTVAVLRDAVGRGARFGVLESSAMGHPVYRRIGFRDVVTFRVFGAPEG